MKIQLSVRVYLNPDKVLFARLLNYNPAFDYVATDKVLRDLFPLNGLTVEFKLFDYDIEK